MSLILITGSAQGIGAESARQLIDLGHQVVLHARNGARAADAVAAIPGAAGCAVGDLADVASTIALAEQANTAGPFDVVIHNAGIGGGGDRHETVNGLERIFHTNVVGPYLLTALMPVSPRVVYLTSGLEADGRWTPGDLQWRHREWNGMQAYSDSKLHDSMLSFEIAARHPESIVNVVDPGWIKTKLGGPDAWDPVEEGAETQVWLATSNDSSATASGRYVKRRETHAPNPTVNDAEARAQLIAELELLTSVPLP